MARYKSRHDKSGGYHSKKYIENTLQENEKKYSPNSRESDYDENDKDLNYVAVDDEYEYEDEIENESDENYEGDYKKKNRPLIIIIVILLILTVLGAGAFAVYHFLLKPEEPKTAPTVPATVAPATRQQATMQEATKQEASTEATETEDEKYLKAAQTYIENMSDEEKIYQMFIVRPEAITGVDVATIAGDATKEAIAKYPVGGILFREQNVEDEDQLKEMIKNTQSYSKTPLFITVSEEGGTASVIQNKLSTTEIKDMYTYKDEGEETAKKNAKTIADSISKFGFNFDLAPVADIFSNSENNVIGPRCYTESFENGRKLIPAAIEGYHEGNMITSLKFFPGTGDEQKGSEEEIAHITKSKKDLISDEISVFRAGIEAGADTVTVGNVIVDELDKDSPATISKNVVPELLKGELRYTGVIMTDSIQSSGLGGRYSADELVKGMINDAMINVMVDPDNIDEYYTAIENAVKSGEIKQTTIDESVAKIIALKMKYGIIK